MNRITVRGRVFAAIALLGLSASPLLSSCQKHESEGPDASVCAIAATVVEQAGTGLVLQLANGSYVVPTGTTWTNFNATAGQTVTVGYSTGKGKCGSGSTAANGQTVELGCITAVTPTTTTTTTSTTGRGSN
ncbi:hypothetical protein [Hymenobacter daeguensis]